MGKKELELYIHIPFCVKKCAYCDFLSGPADEKVRESYVKALCREITLAGEEAEQETEKENGEKTYEVKTVFVGGGTPSVLTAGQMQRIMEAVYGSFSVSEEAEITLEVNPGTVDIEKLSSYKKSGMNRLSIGLQSANDEELRVLGRIHNYDTFLQTFHMARSCGFDNLTVDLISAVPGQTLISYEESLRKVIALGPEHISAYSLILEEGTPFYEWYEKEPSKEPFQEHPLLPDEETERAMYKRTKELLQQAGYSRYEVSNYARHGKECRHNIGYWLRKEYLGLGIGAASLINETRFSNVTDLSEYISYMNGTGRLEKLRENREILKQKDQIEETMMLGLRMERGVSEKEFADRFGKTLMQIYRDVIKKYSDYGFLIYQNGFLRLSEEGISVSNQILADFLFDR